MTAVQMVVEEKFVGGNDVPALQAVGWEGKILEFLTLPSCRCLKFKGFQF